MSEIRWPCPICGSEKDTASQLAAARAEVAILRNALLLETGIVDRIWDQLGRPSFEELKGRSIYDLIDALKSERDTAWEDMKAEVIKAIDDYERDWDVPWRDDLTATIRNLTEYPLTNRIL